MANTIARDMLGKVLKDNGITKKQLIDKYNALHPEDVTSSQNLANKLAKGTLRYHEMVDLMSTIGYEVRLTPIGAPVAAVQTDSDTSFIDNMASQEKPLYVHCADLETSKRFLAHCEMDGYTFEDGAKPTEKEISDLYRILPKKKICFCGVVGHIRLQADRENIEVIEY